MKQEWVQHLMLQPLLLSHPVKQGLIQSLGVFFDTMLVCTATAIMILLYSGLKFGESAPQGVAVTQSALNEHLGSAGGIFLNSGYNFICFFISCR